MKIFPVSYKQEIRFVDIDVMGHVNNAIYLNYFEQARMKWFENITDQKWDWYSFGILLARNEINYREPVRLEEDLHIEVWCSHVGNKSMSLNYEVYVVKGDEKKMKADGLSVMVCFDYHSKKTIPVPDDWRKKLSVANNQ